MRQVKTIESKHFDIHRFGSSLKFWTLVTSKEAAVLFCFVTFEMFEMNENKKTEEKLAFIVR